MTEFTFNGADLEKMFSKIEKLILDNSKIFEISYENRNDTAFNYNKNNQQFIDAIKGNPVVYCIWLKKKSEKKFVPVYIGHVCEKGARSRMRAHLSNKNKQTGSRLDMVKLEVKKGTSIGISFVKVRPAYMRAAVEEWLIEKNSTKYELWNNHKNKKKNLML